MKHIFTSILFIVLCFSSFSQEKRLARKAANAIDQNDYTKALSYYDQILARDSNSFRGNAGKGIVLSEFMGQYEKAIPYLEKALKSSPQEVSPKINNDLGRSYHHVGNYSKALYHYGKASGVNDEDSPYYDALLTKRIADCKFAMEHPVIATPEEQKVSNIGTVVNTDMAEYGPVYVNGNLIFTSKRKDTPKEKKNGIDGRYFESMYIASVNGDNYATPRRYTIPDLGAYSEFYKGNESAVTVSGDGKRLYVFKGGDLYEADLTNTQIAPKKLEGNINDLDFHPFAFVSYDEHTMFLVGESAKDGGGTDIYQSFKNADGTWSKPMLLPFSINTEYNEDAPYMSEDGTLYFASNGLPGYGGYDIYKTKYVNGEWTAPVNLGQPINTPGDEIYMTLEQGKPDGFYASSRSGGYGDLDIYRVHYVSTEVPECGDNDTMLAISAIPGNNMTYTFSAYLPEKYSGKVKSYNWKINGLTIPGEMETTHYTFSNTGNYKVSTSAVIYCDTCPSLIIVCNERDLNVNEQGIVSNDAPIKAEFTNTESYLIGWNMSPLYFDYDESYLRDDAKRTLDQNVSILKENLDLTLVISGYADARGTDEYNKELSSRRVGSVKNYLLKNGISRYRITGTIAYGEGMIENGCVDGVECSEEKHQENRKVELKVSNSKVLYTKVTMH